MQLTDTLRFIKSPASVPFKGTFPHVFLCGGISGCPNWQLELERRLAPYPVVTMNPRRDEFDVTDANLSQLQIEWEHKHLALADAISFWFPCETMNPITLFELGAWAYSAPYNKPIFVGLHPEYPRRFDVEHQLRLQRPDIEIVYSFSRLSYHISRFVMLYQKERESAGVDAPTTTQTTQNHAD